MSGGHSHPVSQATTRALGIIDILCQVFKPDTRMRKRMSHKDLFCCALVSRAFCEPALRTLWRTMSPPTPLLADPESTTQQLTDSELIDAVLSKKTYTEPAWWTRFMWYACFIQELRIDVPFCTEPDKHNQLIDALVSHNGGESIFPSLRVIGWPSSSYSDSSYCPLVTPQVHSAFLDFPRSIEDNICCPDKDPQSHTFLVQLRISSLRLRYLSIDAFWAHLGARHSLTISSFEHLTGVKLTASISFTSFRHIAAMPCMESLLIAHVRLEAPEPSHPHVPIHALRLRQISVGGDCSSLIQLFTALRAPILVAAGLHAMCDNPEAEAYADFESSIEAFSTACSPATITEICTTLDENAEGPTSTAYLYDLLKPLLVFPNLKRFSMSCPMLELFSDDDDFDIFARAWRKLRKFELWQAFWYWYSYVDAYTMLHTEVPTPKILESFRIYCPDLWELALPYLNLNVDVPQPHLQKARSRHRLKRLSFGGKDSNEEDSGTDEGVPSVEQMPALENRKVKKWARYIHRLFPRLDAEYCLSECRSMSSTGWVEVFARIRDRHKARKCSPPGATVVKGVQGTSYR